VSSRQARSHAPSEFAWEAAAAAGVLARTTARRAIALTKIGLRNFDRICGLRFKLE
jgi:hypothetical protein